MKQFLGLTTYNKINISLIFSIIVGLFVSRALISIAVLLMFTNVIAHLFFFKHNYIFKGKLTNLLIVLLPLFFLAYIFTADDKHYVFNAFIHKIPLLVIPVSIYLMQLKQNQIYYLLLIFLFFAVLSSVVVLVNYLGNYTSINQQLQQGIPFPTPHNDHVRYSLMLAFGAILSFFYAIQHKKRFVFFFISVYLSVFLHLLSVRIGMVSLYLGVLILIFFVFYKFKKKRYLLIFSALLFIMPIFSYQFIPSFKSRINFMKYDWQSFQKGEYGHNSDSRRLLSLQVGWQLIKENPITGLSPDKMKEKVNQFYIENYPSIESHNRKLPHNQILYTWLELGLFATLILILAFFIPILNHSLFKYPLLYALLLIFFTSMMFDNTLETQLGMSFFAVFSSLLISKEIE